MRALHQHDGRVTIKIRADLLHIEIAAHVLGSNFHIKLLQFMLTVVTLSEVVSTGNLLL